MNEIQFGKEICCPLVFVDQNEPSELFFIGWSIISQYKVLQSNTANVNCTDRVSVCEREKKVRQTFFV